MSYAARLRAELQARAEAWASEGGLPHECTLGARAAVIFGQDASGLRANFHPASWARIRSRPEWLRRLEKRHTTARRNTASHEEGRSELDAATSSDALLMNIFCHPRALAGGSRLRALLGTEPCERLRFGHRPRIPLSTGEIECTEVDLRIGDVQSGDAQSGGLLIEAKLTETDFQRAPRARLLRYRDFEPVFDPTALAEQAGCYLHSQLIRGALAAFAEPDCRFCLVCDARRPDLVEAWFRVVRAVRDPGLRLRLQLVTWQELAAAMPPAMQRWLAAKYGILAPGGRQPGRPGLG